MSLYPSYWRPEPKREAPQPSKPPRTPTPEVEQLMRTYQNLRLDCIDVEELIGSAHTLSEKDLKRLDKAVTVMKVSFKLIKVVLRSYGYRRLKPASEQVEAA